MHDTILFAHPCLPPRTISSHARRLSLPLPRLRPPRSTPPFERRSQVCAVADSSVWQLDRTSFRNIVAHNTQGTKETTLEVLDNVEHLKDLNPSQKLRLVDALCETTFSQGELIISKGDPGTVFYIIKEGTVECTGLPDGGTMTLNKGQYFGERALLLGEMRACNVTVVSPEVTCLLLDKVDFYELLGEGQVS